MDQIDWQIIHLLQQYPSATRVSDFVHLSQPAVTYRLEKMENEVKAQLFVRSNKGVFLTTAGQKLAAHAIRIMNMYNHALKDAQAGEADETGLLEFGCSRAFSDVHLPNLLRAFCRQHKNMTVNILSRSSTELLQMVHREEIMLAIVRGDHFDSAPYVKLMDEPILILSPEPISDGALLESTFINMYYDSSLQYVIDSWWKERFAHPPKKVINSESLSGAVNMVRAGLGWAIAPQMRVPNMVEGVFLRELAYLDGTPIRRDTGLIYSREIENFVNLRAFMWHILDWYEREHAYSKKMK